jgi:hypothetical protein
MTDKLIIEAVRVRSYMVLLPGTRRFLLVFLRNKTLSVPVHVVSSLFIGDARLYGMALSIIPVVLR